MKKELEKLQPDISNIIYRGLAKFVPDHKINLVDDVATDLVEYISERLVKNNGVLDDVIKQSEQLLAYTEWLKNEGLLNATVSKLIVKKYQSK